MSREQRPMQFRNFYPGDLTRQIAEFLAKYAARSEEGRRLIAGVVPHAGWRYSGGVAARTLKALADGSRAKSILLLGAVHRAWLKSSAVYPSGEWQTPLGPVAVDAELAREVLEKLGSLVEPNTSAHDSEHSIEVDLPFLHELFPGVPVVPIMIPPEASPTEAGRRLAQVVSGRDVIAVASTDLTHYGLDYSFTPAGLGEEARVWMRGNDQRILDLATSLQAEPIPGEARAHRNACGPGALAAAVAFARELGTRQGTVLEHTSSYEVTGKASPFEMGVGYAGVVF
jgi:hypothetical protein